MSDTLEEFEAKLYNAIEAETQWFDNECLRQQQENYRLHLTCLNNIIEALVKKSLVAPDPYKKDKKISGIVPLDSSEFNDNERTQLLGIRLSDYESMVDYVCSYMKFSVENLNIETLRKLVELNNSFTWSNLSQNSPKINTRSLAFVVNQLKLGSDPLVLSTLSDSLVKTNQALNEIGKAFKDLADFQKERYKADVRKNVMRHSSFNMQKALESPQSMVAEIKHHFAVGMGKRPFVPDLIEEIAQESIGERKDDIRERLISKLKVTESKKQKKEEEINTHDILMDSVRTIGSLADQLDQVFAKEMDNHQILQSTHNSFFEKLAKMFREICGIPEPTAEYDITLVDRTTNAKRKERLNFTQFMDNLSKRTRFYSSFSVKNTPGYNKINSQNDDAILDFVGKQILECNKLMAQLSALDEFFKGAVEGAERAKVKGIRMELTTLKNLVVKANQQKAEYIAYVEEQRQMKSLGII